MAKIAILTDTHFGYKPSGSWFAKGCEDFFLNQFFPALDKHNVEQVIHIGDLFHRQQSIDIQLLSDIRKWFTEPLRQRSLPLHIVLGNHDIYWQKSNRLDAVRQIFFDHPSFQVYDRPTMVQFPDARKVMMVPWICKEFMEGLDEMLAVPSDLLCGHFALVGTKLPSGIKFPSSHQLVDRASIQAHKKILLGHYHVTETVDPQAAYLGTPYQMEVVLPLRKGRWAIWDTMTGTIEYIENTKFQITVLNFDDKPGDVTDQLVRLLVPTSTTPAKLKKMLSLLETKGAARIETKPIQDTESDGDTAVLQPKTGDTVSAASIQQAIADTVEMKVDRSVHMEVAKNLWALYQKAS